MTPSQLDAPDLKRTLRRYLERLYRYKEALNRLNVYPVPDGDTGTNMTLTVESVVEECEATTGMEDLATAISRASLIGARGSSGVILAQILRGLADAFGDRPTVGCPELVEGLGGASEAAYQAVLRPVEGTILTVVREAARAAREVETAEGESLSDLLQRVYDRAEHSLEGTPELLPVLREAGVVDAGGAGFLLLVVSFLEEVTGREVTPPERIFEAAAVPIASQGTAAAGDDLRYEVMYLLETGDGDLDGLKKAWAEIGDSIVVVGGDGMWKCHIHTNDIGAAIEAGIQSGRPFGVKVTDLWEQVPEEEFHRHPGFEPLLGFAEAAIGVVAVAAGTGVVEMLRGAGVQGVVGDQAMKASAKELLDVVEGAAAKTVIVLPNDRDVVPVADEIRALSSKRVLVVPTTSVAQGLAAMMEYRPDSDDAETLAAAMAQAAETVATGEIVAAVRDAATPVGDIREGDWLGIVDGSVTVVKPNRSDALIALLAEVVGPQAQLVTLITGEGSADDITKAAEAWIARHRSGAEVDVIEGGQPLFPYLVSVE
ncbi:MAG: DAK2 domain-containing protein [Acidimicrobiia bacterium]